MFIYVDADGLGQASASLAGGRLELLTRRMKLQQQRAAAAAVQLDGTPGGEEGCSCRCLPYLRAYREDLGICVDDIHGECDCESDWDCDWDCALRKPLPCCLGVWLLPLPAAIISQVIRLCSISTTLPRNGNFSHM